ncbi:1422_t:CDS:2 [Funneliformis mosseae]|uniref:CCR4-Not complex 3'-5'-exoribonuclease subunit Ccr4 n=1 Tax=Funneliformis mosseae TaxID=27381 RepID=A0A9N8WDU8_FUNMO|nr:1422_t:CDS:2 [Funneliformis mosseae]
MSAFPHQLIYQPNNSSNGPVSPVHSPTHTPSPPTTSPGQTSPSINYPISHGVPAIYGGGNLPLFSFQTKLPHKMQPPLSHAFGPHPILNQNSGPPGQSLMQQTSMTVSQPQLNIALSTSVTNPLSVSSAHWQQQLNYAQLSRQSASPHHHARQAAVAARSSLGSSAIAITDPNNPNKAPLNGIHSKKENGEKLDQPFQQWMTIDLGGMGLKNISKELFRYHFLTTLYISHNNLTYVSPEVSKLRCLTILDMSGNKLSVLPSELGMLTNLKELLLFDNMLVTLPFELGTLYQLETLGLEGNPINETIKSILQKDGTSAVIHFLRDNCQVPPQPMERDWIMLENEAGGDRDTFTLLCYNILCDKYATTQLYGYTPSWALQWDYRKELIKHEVLSYNADIVCLQEVDTSQYDEYFKDSFNELGDYDSVYWPKSRAKTMADWERKSVDGCATFYKNSKYKLIDKQLIEFNQVALQRSDFKKTEDMFNRVITKDNIAVITLLENRETLSRVIVANCHIHWDPSYADVKLVQVAMLMDELDKLGQKWCTIPNHSLYNYSSPQKISTIICGDFNSTPDSGVYEFLTRGSIRQDHNDFGNHIYGSYTSDGLSHKLSLKSSYSNIEELPFTNFTPSFTGVIDYIWYSTNTLSVTGLLGGIDKEYLSKMVGFPNAHFPSDHVVILAEFRVKPPQTIQPPPQFGIPSSNSRRLNSQRK